MQVLRGRIGQVEKCPKGGFLKLKYLGVEALFESLSCSGICGKFEEYGKLTLQR